MDILEGSRVAIGALSRYKSFESSGLKFMVTYEKKKGKLFPSTTTSADFLAILWHESRRMRNRGGPSIEAGPPLQVT